jgi:hypothetical protein
MAVVANISTWSGMTSGYSKHPEQYSSRRQKGRRVLRLQSCLVVYMATSTVAITNYRTRLATTLTEYDMAYASNHDKRAAANIDQSNRVAYNANHWHALKTSTVEDAVRRQH